MDGDAIAADSAQVLGKGEVPLAMAQAAQELVNAVLLQAVKSQTAEVVQDRFDNSSQGNPSTKLHAAGSFES